MALRPIRRKIEASRCWLAPFHADHAPLIASWVGSAQDAFWLAPRTPPPITPEKIAAWGGKDREPLVLVEESRSRLLAYGELNLLNRRRNEYWLGHLLVDPSLRGHGLGRRLTDLLVARAFDRYRAARVLLVVFPENRSAVACYQAAGFVSCGRESHAFPEYATTETLVRMHIVRRRLGR